MNASLAKVLSEMEGSLLVESHAVAEAEKLMESSQMNVEMSA